MHSPSSDWRQLPVPARKAKVRRHSRQRRSWTSYKPFAERLEDRCSPAVNVLGSFAGLAEVDTQGYTPPDTCGAAGPVKYVETVNQTIRITNRDGSSPVSDAFDHLWYTTGGLPAASPGSFLSDPIVMWDDQVQRFIVGDQDVDFGTHVSTFDLAISKSASPATLTTTDWYFKQIVTTENSSSNTADADYPGNFGFNHDAFVFCLNMFAVTGSNYVQVNSVKISDLVNGTLTAFRNDVPGVFSLRPTVMHDSVAGDPMWLITEGGNDASIKVLKMTNVLSNAANFTTYTLAVKPYLPINDPLNPDGSVVVYDIDTRILKAAEWGGKLVASQHVGVSSNEDDARWYEIDVSSGTPTLADQGDVTNAATASGVPNTYDYYPSVDINSAGVIGMSFMQSSHTGTNQGEFMSMYVTGRTPSDPAGTMEAPVWVVAGAANYSDSFQRAGDLSGISVDQDGSFWSANEYATASGRPNWGTWIAHYSVGLAAWTVNQPGYNQMLLAPGGTGPFTYALSGGNLPAGMSLSSMGILAGTPTAVGSFTFTVTVTDSAGTSTSQIYTIAINPPVAVTTTPPANAPLGTPYSQVITASGGTPSYAFSATGSVPPGLTLSSRGVLSGRATAVGPFSFTVTATDSTGAAGSQSYTMYVFAFSPSALPSWTVNQPGYSQTITVSGGTAPYNFSAAGTLPPGMTLSSDGVFSGVPTAAGTYSFTVTVTDSGGVAVSAGYSITIDPRPTLQSILTDLGDFNGSVTGSGPSSGLIADSKGDLFGTTIDGGTFGYGTVFELVKGSATITTLASFDYSNGANPQGGSLVEDASGNLFGITTQGGGLAAGTVFEVIPGSGTITTLANFNGFTGQMPIGNLAEDSNGNLFGSTYGGPAADGTVFEVLKDSGQATVLASFDGTDGSNPFGGLIEDSSGNLFGTTYRGGTFGDGTVFELVKGSASVTTLATFDYANGANPIAALMEDSSGDLFGTTRYGGTYGYGTVFELASASHNITTLTSFNLANGANPWGSLIEDSSGNLFGTTSGDTYSYGTVFELPQGSTTIKTLVSFTGTGGPNPGSRPLAGLIEDSSGNLFGTTQGGGASGDGTLYEVSSSLPGWTVNVPGYSQTIMATGGTGSLTFSLGSGTLPPGLTLSSTGMLTGTPATVGSFTLTVMVTDSVGGSDSKSYTVVIHPPPAMTSPAPPNDARGYAYSQTFTASGGTMPYTFSTSGTLPPGLTLSHTGVLSGTPTATGAFTFTVIVTDSTLQTASQTDTIYVFGFNPTTLVSGSVHAPYSQTITVAGGTAPYTFTTTGTLPPGLSLSSEGVLSGVPTTTGPFNFFVSATDSLGISVRESYSVTIATGLVLLRSLGTSVNFNGSNGRRPWAGLIQDSMGDLFGTTSSGGTFGNGTVFEIPVGTSSLVTLASFNDLTNLNGKSPIGNLLVDGSGNLFGTTEYGGALGYGTVFELVKGSATITTLAFFDFSIFDFSNGANPQGSLVEDASGNLFGTATNGGPLSSGTVFEVVSGSGAITTLASFNGANGAYPLGSVVEDSSGDLFGATSGGGAFGDGTVFEILHGNGRVITLASFNGSNGFDPVGGVIADSNGNIFGTTVKGGTFGHGTVFELPRSSASITTLASFNFPDGAAPEGSLIEDSSGVLYGTTPSGGPSGGGTVFKVIPGSGVPTDLASFNVVNGSEPVGTLVDDSSGDLFGTTAVGGPFGAGTVFEVSDTIPDWTVNQPGYSQTLLAHGGIGSLTFSLTGGSLPTGVTLSSTGILMGTPTAQGSFHFTVTVSDSVSASDSHGYLMLIQPPPQISASQTLPSWTVGVPYAQPIAVSGGTVPYTYTVSSGHLPPGLSFAADGVSGTPTTAGNYNFTLTVMDASGSSSTSQTVTLTINPPVLITPAAVPNWTVNLPGYNQTISAAQGTGTKTLTFSGSLPPGLVLSSSDVLSGTPTVVGTYQFTVTVMDSVGASASQTFIVTINPPVMITTTNSGTWTAGYPFVQAIFAVGGTGGKTFSAPAASLPPGISVLAGGTLSGTPTMPGSYTFTVTATDTVGATATQVFTMVVNSPVTVTPTVLPNWTVNQSGYSQTFSASGGTGSLTLSVIGTLPAGLALTSGGTVLSGTPTSASTYAFTVTAQDSLGAMSSRSYTVVINPPVALPASIMLADTINIPYSQTITATGGTGTVLLTVSNVTGAIPGLTVPASATGSLAIIGTPTAPGTETFTVTATDLLGSTSTQSYMVVVNPAISITTTSLATWTDQLAGYSQTISASGGTGTLTFKATSLPPGLSLSNIGVLAGSPSATGTYSFTVTATDSVGAGGNQSLTVLINPSVAVAAATLAVWTANLAGYNQKLTATGGTGTLTFGVTGTLPTGLTLSSAGLLSGTPTVAGSYTFTASASDTLGASGSQSFSITINPVVTLFPGVLPSSLQNVAYNKTITTNGGTGTVAVALSNITGAITGLTVAVGDTGSIAISGTPTATGTEQFTVTATDTLGASAVVTYSIIINPATVYLTLPTSGYSGTPGGMIARFPISINQLQDQASTNHVGLQQATLAVTFPTGVFNFPLGSGNATPDVGLGSVPLSDSIAPGGASDWTWLATAPADGQLNITLTAKFGKKITTDNPASGGSLMVINFPVFSSYAPTAPTTIAITVVAANGATHTSILGSNGTYVLLPTTPYAGSVIINPPLAIISTSLTDWTVGLPGYQQTIGTSGGTAPLTFSATGSLPAGLTLTSTGVLAGSPSATGTYTFTVTVGDASGASASQNYTVTINPPVVINSTALDDLTAGVAASQTVAASGGTGPLTFSESGSLPAALALSSDGVLTGTATAAGAYPITITAADTVGASASQNFTVVIAPGPFSEYTVTVVGPTWPSGTSTVAAGSPFLVAVQAADAYGNAISNYSGPAVVSASIAPAGGGPMSGGYSVSMNTYGIGLFQPTLTTASTYSITVSGASYLGSGTVTVTAGPPARVAFVAQPQNTPTGVPLPPVTVQVQDLYGNPIATDNSDVVSLMVVSGPGRFTGGSTTNASVQSGVATFNNLTLAVPGSYVLAAQVPSLYTGPYSSPFTIAPLEVEPGSFVGTPSGFALQFNAPYLVNSLTPVLYGYGFGTSGTAPSVILTTDPGNLDDKAAYVSGSLVLDQANNRITFVNTTTANLVYSKLVGGAISPLLPDGAYTAIVRSSAATDGFQALYSGGGFLDGLGSGTPGSGDFVATFTVNPAAAHDDIVWLPPTADGPGQALSAPGMNQAGGGYPIYLSDSGGTVTAVQVSVNYNPALLTVTGVSGAGLSLAASSTPGQAMLQYSGPALPAGVQTPIGYLLATVPAGTAASPEPYKAKDLLHLSNISLNGGAIPAVGGDALHLVAYVADADGSGAYSSNDAVLITRTLLGTDSGFTAYPLVDPVIVADTDGDGFIPADAALQANEAGAGLPTANLSMPPIPSGVVFQPIANNVDPSISIPSTLQVGANGTVTVPVNIDDAHPQGSTGLIEAHLALTYDPSVFTVSAADVHPGSLLAGGDWSIVPTIDPATGQIGIALSSTAPITSTIGGSLVTIDFHPTGTFSGPAPFELVASADPDGQYVATELEDAQGTFTLSPAPTNGFDPRIDGVVLLAPATAPAPVSILGVEAAPPIVSAVAGDVRQADSSFTQTPALVKSADPNADGAPIDVSEREAPAVPTIPAVSAAAHIAAVAASNSLASLPADTPVGLLGALIGQIGGASTGRQISTSQPLADQFFQALARWMSGPADTVVPITASDSYARVLAGQLLPVPPTPDSLDSLNWDEVISDLDFQSARNLLDYREPDDGRLLPAAKSLADADQAIWDEYFAQTAGATDQAAEDERTE